MIKQLTEFARRVQDEDMLALRQPLKGLHIKMRLMADTEGRVTLDEHNAEVVYWNGKKEPDDFIIWTMNVIADAWMVGTNKCLDLPEKGIHSASPYCVSMKRDSLEGGDKFSKDKVKITARYQRYFSNSLIFLDEETLPELGVWTRFFTEEGHVMTFLERFKELYERVDMSEYVTFYLDRPMEAYSLAHQRYLADKLFNTPESKTPNPDNPLEIMGTSDFFNGFNSKKPYLEHKSATFAISGRITEAEAHLLRRFQQLMGYRILPNPLPIFVSTQEAEALQQELFRVAKIQFDGEHRPSHKSVIQALLENRQREGLGNYYLLYHAQGEILDFDFVPKFEYKLQRENGQPWMLYHSLFTSKVADESISNVFDFQDSVLPALFNNALVVKRKDKTSLYNWFGDLGTKDSSTLFLVQTYRQTFYDFIYKSRRSAITFTAFYRIMRKSIFSDLKADKIEKGYHTHERFILEKLNIWFSFYHSFSSSPQHTTDMVNHLQSLRAFTVELVKKDSPVFIEQPAQFAFVSGQIIRYIFQQISSEKQPHEKLERFLRAKSGDQLKSEITKLYTQYRHIKVSGRFERAMGQFMACSDEQLNADALPFMLAGYFSDNTLFADKVKKEEIPNEDN